MNVATPPASPAIVSTTALAELADGSITITHTDYENGTPPVDMRLVPNGTMWTIETLTENRWLRANYSDSEAALTDVIRRCVQRFRLGLIPG